MTDLAEQQDSADLEAEMKRITDSIDSPAIAWRVLCINRDYNIALVITRNCVAQMPFHEPGDAITWKHSTLRAWLNGKFYDSLPDGVRSRVEEAINENLDNPENNVPGGGETRDKVFLLSTEEAEMLFPSDSERTTRYKEKVAWWWLRSAGNDPWYIANVYSGGNINPRGDRADYPTGGVRPALWLSLDED